MRNQGQLVLGLLVIFIGMVLLSGNIFDVNLWVLCWPSLLILLGLSLLFRPQLVGSRPEARWRLLGDIRRDGIWQVSDEELWIGIGDVQLDLTEAEIPPGETRIRIWIFVGDVRLYVPADVGVTVSSTALVASVRIFGQKQDVFLTPRRFASEEYDEAERKIRLETTAFVGDIKVERQ